MAEARAIRRTTNAERQVVGTTRLPATGCVRHYPRPIGILQTAVFPPPAVEDSVMVVLGVRRFVEVVEVDGD